ncbi:MFS sugar transporter [Gallibacterium anatis]|uniref:MFS transporter n=1 Tax=Gallibacterium anatis TaxID=750 RepID=UPI000531CEB6|nr:MFS transporter [Gallibacterium anatis]KGQ44510.1 MFS sugar transporter [Gallibacterium anatis]KGQ50066.1 MFS sugar transporter [Gallibacterium anatis]KGQ58411.1 MFS sugar transporter [Gallibacterium anatis]KGQ64923.1 MFS sugar transporter [Gallibacterium anatis 7990]
MPVALFALMIGAFAIGTTEFVIVGLVPTIAQSLAISVPSAGLLVSLYALSVAVSAPLLTAMTARWQRRNVLLFLMAIFVVGNFLAWQATNFSTLIGARIVTGLAHGVFFSIGSTIATQLVTKEKAAAAIAMMFTGLTVALVTGVPLGAYIGQHFGWQTTFLAVMSLGVIAFIGALLFVPKNLQQPKPVKLIQQLDVIRSPRLLLVYAMTALGYGGTFVLFTFLSPMLQQLAGFNGNDVSLILVGYGIAVALGNTLGGKLADKLGTVRSLKYIFSVQMLVLFSFYFTAQSAWAVLISTMLLGLTSFATVPPLQLLVVEQAKIDAPQSVDVASGLNIAAFNLGITIGSGIGGQVVAKLRLLDTAWVGAVILAVTLLLVALFNRIQQAKCSEQVFA